MEDPMRCPSCSAEMDKGKVCIDQLSWVRILAVGLSANSLYFQSDAGGDAIEVMEAKPAIPLFGKYIRDACRCQQCGCVVIVPGGK